MSYRVTSVVLVVVVSVLLVCSRLVSLVVVVVGDGVSVADSVTGIMSVGGISSEYLEGKVPSESSEVGVGGMLTGGGIFVGVAVSL